jgi:hypothetical protein
VVERETLALHEVLSRGAWLMSDGQIVRRERFLENSQRNIRLVGDKNGKQ